MSSTMRKQRRTVNKILLTYKLGPQRGSSSLLCSTKANIPASWRRGDKYRWDGTSRFLKNTVKHRRFSPCFHMPLGLYTHYLSRSHSSLSLCLPPSPGPTGGDTPLVSVVSCPALIMAMPSCPSKIA